MKFNWVTEFKILIVQRYNLQIYLRKENYFFLLFTLKICLETPQSLMLASISSPPKKKINK